MACSRSDHHIIQPPPLLPHIERQHPELTRPFSFDFLLLLPTPALSLSDILPKHLPHSPYKRFIASLSFLVTGINLHLAYPDFHFAFELPQWLEDLGFLLPASDGSGVDPRDSQSLEVLGMVQEDVAGSVCPPSDLAAESLQAKRRVFSQEQYVLEEHQLHFPQPFDHMTGLESM